MGLVAQFLTPSPPGELSPPVPLLGPSYSKVLWKPLQTGGESLCTCGIKQKSKQIAKREQAYSPALKMNTLNVRDCREICPIPVDPRGLASSPGQTLHGGRCRRAVGSWFVFCKYGERGWKRCWAPAFALGAADAPDQSGEDTGGAGLGYGGAAAWDGGGKFFCREHNRLQTALYLKVFLWWKQKILCSSEFILFSLLWANEPESGNHAGKISMLSK